MVETLIEAVVLVFLVMYLFLQNFRYTLIPTIVVPVALLGTFGVLLGARLLDQRADHVRHGAGDRHRGRRRDRGGRERRAHHERGRPAAARSDAQGDGPDHRAPSSASRVVLVSVFVPMAFFAGSVGNIYRQFSLVMVASMLFSAFMALSLTPALCATLLKPVEAGHHHEKSGFFGWFNRGFHAHHRRLRRLGVAQDAAAQPAATC